MTTELKSARAALADAEYYSYDADAFPGSKAAMANRAAYRALVAFDLAHPEIAADRKAEIAAARAVRLATQSNFVKSGS